jgi:hypothetical protein
VAAIEGCANISAAPINTQSVLVSSSHPRVIIIDLSLLFISIGELVLFLGPVQRSYIP